MTRRGINKEQEMDTWAIQAAVQTALTSGIGTDGIPVASSGSLDGFVLGLSLAGMAAVTASTPWKLRSSRRPASQRRHLGWHSGSRRAGPGPNLASFDRADEPSHQVRGRLARAGQRRRAEKLPAMSLGARPDADRSAGSFTPTEQSRPYADVAPQVDIERLTEVLARADRVLGAARASAADLAVEAGLGGNGLDEADVAPLARAFSCPDEEFWGPAADLSEPFEPAPAGAYRSKHRLTGSEERTHGEPYVRPSGQRRAAPRHAAPQPGITGRLSVPRLPRLASRSSHAPS
jgi:hypothetical protein